MEVPAKFKSVLTGFRYWLLVLIFMAASTFLVACSGGDTTVITTNPPVTTTTTMTLPPVVDDLDIIPDAPINVSTKDTVTIYVLAKDGTDEVEGETIYFDINPNPSGASLDFPSDVTGPGGVASVIYTAGFFNIPATDTITARTLSGITETVDITVNPPEVDSITIEASAAELTADGADQTKITVTVEDVNNDPAAGVDIALTTTAGDLCAWTPPATCNEAQPYTVATDADGIVEITLQASVNLGTATIEAETPEGDSVSTTVEFIVGAPANISLSAQPSTITANGSKTSTISATVTDANSHLVGSGETIYFTIINPLADPGTLSASSAVTVNGIAQVTYSPGTSTGNVDIEASTSGGGITTQATPLITLTIEIVDTIDLVLGKTILVADGADNTLVTATVTNTDGFPVVDGTPVDFTTTGGDLGATTTITPPVPALTGTVTGGAGIASVYLQSSTTLGAYTVSANSGGKFDFEQVEFVAGLANAGFSSLAANPGSIEANGTSTAVLVLVARDAGDDPVVDGTVVEFTTTTTDATICAYTDTLCTAPADPLIATTTGGVALAIIRSTTAPTNPVNLAAFIDDGSFVTETATMIFGDNDSINPNYITLTLTGGGGDVPDGTYLPVESPVGNSAILVEATVFDGFGSPIPDNCTDNIEFEIISGPADAKLDGSTATVTKTTDSDGSASVSLTAGTTTGTVRIQVRAVKESDCSALLNVFATTTPVVIGSGEAKFLYIYPNPDVTDNPDSTTSQVINAMVTDAYGNPVEDGTAVDFTLVDPELGEGVCLTGSTGASTDACGGSATPMQGVARTMLTWAPSFIWGSYVLNASTSVDPPVNAVTDTYYGDYPAVAPLSIDVTFSPTSSVASVTPGLELWVELRDGSNLPDNTNPIDGITMDFTSNNPGVLDIGPPASDVTGDPNITGYATVDADVVNCSTSSVPVSVTATVSGSPYSDSATLNVGANDQVADFSATPQGAGSFTVDFATAGLTTPQTGTTIADPAGYSWNFGDGTFGTGSSTFRNYGASGGTYSVTLTVTNSEGCVTVSESQDVIAP